MKYELVNSSDEYVESWTIIDKEKNTTIALFWDKDIAEKCLEMLNNTIYYTKNNLLYKLIDSQCYYHDSKAWCSLCEEFGYTKLTEQQAKEQFPEAFKQDE